MSDATSIRSRASTFLNRPQTAPMGPRTRKSKSNLIENLLEQRSLSSALDLHEFGGHSLSRPTSLTSSSPSSPSFLSNRVSLPVVSEEPKTTLDSVAPIDSVHAYEEEETRSITTTHSEDSSARVLASPALPKLVPPAGIKFESTPVPWKAHPLEVALCKCLQPTLYWHAF